MKKVAIVGVEGSGKTVMLAGLGELYSKPDEQGYFLSPKNFATASYVADKIARMRQGEWPTATAEDVLQGLDWSIRRKGEGATRPQDVCEVSCLDFAGEVYRAAFGIRAESAEDLSSEAESLKAYVQNADDVIVLINLRDIIVNGIRDKRVQESLWITKSILQYALESRSGRKEPRAALVLTQADSYADTIRACGGAKGVLEAYLRDVANNYGWLDVFAVSAVDKTSLDDDGHLVPAPDFSPTDLHEVLDWIVAGVDRRKTETGSADDDRPRSNRDNGEVAALADRLCDVVHEEKFYGRGNIPSDKLANAMKSMRVRESAEDVLLLFDTTVFGSAEEGLLMTSRALYGKDLYEAPFRIAWSSLSRVKKTGLVFSYWSFFDDNGNEFKLQVTGTDSASVSAFVKTLNSGIDKGLTT